MKIGILTFHDGINHGAYLQAYGLYKFLESLGHDVRIINYKNFRHWFNEYKCFLRTKRPGLLFSNVRKILKFRREQRNFTTTSFTFSHEKVQKEYFDVIVVGSDIVWNFKNPLFGFDSIYFGHFLNAGKIISYAASFGSIDINEPVPQSAIQGLERFSKISVRDENSQQILERMLGKPVELVLDPSFLYDFSQDEIRCPYSDFILIYSFRVSQEQIQQIKDFSQKRKIKTIAVGYSRPWCDKNIVAVSPFEWLGYFRNAKYVITSTFHGTMFSIKYNKMFCTLPNKPINNKIKHVLEFCGLNGQIYEDGKIPAILESDIDYEVVNKKLSELITKSKNYLRSLG